MDFAYLPQTAILFAWIALLPWSIASWGFFLIIILLTALSVPVWMKVSELNESSINFMAWTFASWPVLWGIRLENLSMFILPLIALACLLFKFEHHTAAGILLAVATTKPQLAALLVAYLVLFAVVQRAWNFIYSFALTLALLLLGSALLLPGWFEKWRAAIVDYTASVGLRAAYPLWVEMAIAPFFVFALWKCQYKHAVALVLAGTAVFMPTNWPTNYNFILLLPACFIVVCSRPTGPTEVPRKIALVLIAIEFVAPVVAVIGDLFFQPNLIVETLPGANVFLPLAVTVALISLTLNQRHGERALNTVYQEV